MNNESMQLAQLLVTVFIQLFAIGVAWGSIKTDLKNIRESLTEKTAHAQGAANSAHERIDRMMERLQTNNANKG